MSGALREPLTLLRPERQADGGGGWSVTWQEAGTVFAAREAQPAANAELFGQAMKRRRQVFTLRGGGDIVFEMRLRHRGRDYRINDIQEADGKDRFLRIFAEEVPQ